MRILRSFFIFFGIICIVYFVFGDDPVPEELHPCKSNHHFTDPKFTCCAKIRYDSPSVYSETNMEHCLSRRKDGDKKIVQSAWASFKCLVDKAIGNKEVDFDNFEEVMSEKLPSNVKSAIKKYMGEMKSADYDPYKDNDKLAGYENYAKVWSAYYTAEHKACLEIGQSKSKDDPAEGRCFSWMEQSYKRGDCCMEVPIPFQLHSDPITLQYYALKNYTATHLLTILGEDYMWQNTTIVMYSDNVAACIRTAKFINQKLVTLEFIKKQIESQTPPNYDEVMEMIIPKYIESGVSNEMKEKIKKHDIENDYTIALMNTTSFSMYKYVFAEEWKSTKINQNSSRYLFWICQTHLLLNRWYKQIDVTDLCF